MTSTVYIRLVNCAAGVRQRTPELERLLVGASTATGSGDWRREAFGCIAPGVEVPSAGAAALWAAMGAAAGHWVCIASPVHLVAGMTDVTLPMDGLLQLDSAESAALAADFNGIFVDSGARLVVGRAAVLLCVFEQMLEVDTHEAAQLFGRELFACQPTGRDAPQLRRLMSEMELWLFEHAVNRARAARGAPAITGLWLWGGGASVSALPAVQGWTAGTDPLFSAYGDAAGYARRPGVLVCDVAPGAAQWFEVERQWLSPLSAALRSGEVDRVILSAEDRRSIALKGRYRHLWRRSKPWWESFELPGVESAAG